MVKEAYKEASLSVCGDSWFILGAMTALHHRCAASPSPESNQSDSGQVRLETSHQPHTLHNMVSKNKKGHKCRFTNCNNS